MEFHDTGMTGCGLVKTSDGWRIHDMGTANDPGLRKVLQDEIAHPPKD